MCGCNGNVTREVVTSAQIAAEAAQRAADSAAAQKDSITAAIGNANGR